jgi:nucleoside-diphosphate-sugar epimerase
VIDDIGPHTDWGPVLGDIDCVVHLAARTHVIDDAASDLLGEYRRTNTEATRNLAAQAAASGVRRFVFLSSIKVNGEATSVRPFTDSCTPSPEDAYGISKHEAEQALFDIAARSAMEAVILRPPLIYGPGVKGNFLRLLQLIDRGIPLPLASIQNRRSLIHVSNLVDAIISCIDSPAAVAEHAWLVSDTEEISTPMLIRKLAEGMGRSALLFPCPVALLKIGATIFGQISSFARLTNSLTVDASGIENALGWSPRINMDQGLIETARWYHQDQIQRGT